MIRGDDEDPNEPDKQELDLTRSDDNIWTASKDLIKEEIEIEEFNSDQFNKECNDVLESNPNITESCQDDSCHTNDLIQDKKIHLTALMGI